MLKQVKENGIPDAVSRASVKRARTQSVRLTTTAGPIFKSWSIPKVGTDKMLVLEYIDPISWLTHIAEHCAGFASFMERCLAQKPSTLEAPWQIALYCDEVTPGNQMRHDNKRKVQAVYWSFLQYGSTSLSCETKWMVLTAARSKLITDIGGMSVFFTYIMETFFGDGRFFAGIPIRCQNNPHILCAKLGLVIADESALKSLYENKGASGYMTCILCRNCVMTRSNLHVFDTSGFLLPLTENDINKFSPATSASIKSSIDLLASKKNTMLKGQFEKLESALGYNFNPKAILASRWFEMISPPKVLMFDWMHCFLVGGVHNLELGLLLGVLHGCGVDHKQIHEWMQSVRWPAALESRGVSGRSAFEKRAGAVNDTFKCSASEGLSIYVPMRLFLLTHVVNLPTASIEVKRACSSYFALAKVLDLLHCTLKGLHVSPEELEQALCKHMGLFKSVYPEEYIIPKFHYGLHLPKMLKTHQMLVCCFVHERKHREIKRFANQVTNTWSNFESSILESVAAAHLSDLASYEDFFVDAVLINPRPAPPDLATIIQSAVGSNADVSYSKAAQFRQGERCCSNDVVVVDLQDGKQICEIWFHVAIDNVCMSCMSLCSDLGDNKFKRSSEPMLILTHAVSHVCVYVSQDENLLIAPATLR